MDYIRQYKSFVNSYNLSGAVRITFGILAPALLLGYFNDLSIGIMVSLGAMCVGNTDNPGPIHHRRNGMMASIVIVFTVTLLTGAASGSPLLTGLLVLLFCFTFSMMGIYGVRASSIGVNALLVMVLSIDRPHHGLDILLTALYVMAGGIWYMLLSLLLYSFRPFRLAQQALGDCAQSTASYLRLKASFYARDVDYDKSYRRLMEEQIDTHEKQELVRELLFKSRDIVKETTHIGRVLVMIFLDIVDLFERVMTSHQDYPTLHKLFDETASSDRTAAPSPILEQFRLLILELADELDGIGIALKSGRPSIETPVLSARMRTVKESLSRFRDEHRTAGNVEGFIGLRQILESIEDIADRLHTLHGYTTYDSSLDKPASRAGDDDSRIDLDQFITHQDITPKLLFDNLNLRSNIFRHSLRVSLATITGYLVSRFLGFGHGYWILLTIIVIMKPAYSLTKRRNFERLTGTLAGALAGLLIIYFIRDPRALFVLMTLFMIGTYVFLRTNYLICVTLMTPYVLLLFHLLYPTDFRVILSDRVIDTAIGSGIAFLASIFFLPSWEHEQMTNYMVSILEDNLRYFIDVSDAWLGRPVTENQYKLSRKHAFVSLANLSDAFSRMLSEPKRRQKEARPMHQFVVSSHMLTSHIATLAYYLPSIISADSSPDYQPVIGSISNRLAHASAALRQTASSAADETKDKEGLRTLNKKVDELMQSRKTELDRGITDSDTRRHLSGLKPIVDQFNFIAKVAADLEKLTINLHSPASPSASSPAPFS